MSTQQELGSVLQSQEGFPFVMDHKTRMTLAPFHGTRLDPRGIVLATQPCRRATAEMVGDLDKEQDFIMVPIAFSSDENSLAKSNDHRVSWYGSYGSQPPYNRQEIRGSRGKPYIEANKELKAARVWWLKPNIPSVGSTLTTTEGEMPTPSKGSSRGPVNRERPRAAEAASTLRIRCMYHEGGHGSGGCSLYQVHGP